MNERADSDRTDQAVGASPDADRGAGADGEAGTDRDSDPGTVAETSGPSIPAVDVPRVPEPGQSDEPGDDESVPTGVKVVFWRLVFLYKFAILGLTLGILLLVFDRGPDLGLELTVLGLLLLAVALLRTRRGKRRLDAGEFEDDEGDERGETDGVGTDGTDTGEQG